MVQQYNLIEEHRNDILEHERLDGRGLMNADESTFKRLEWLHVGSPVVVMLYISASTGVPAVPILLHYS